MKIFNQAMPLAVAIALGAMSGQAMASGFAIGTQSGSGTGNAYAGGAAAAEDASTVFYNPAGMTMLRGTSISAGGSLVKPSLKFQNTASTGADATGNFGGDGGSLTPIPFAYLVTEINPKWRFGVGISAPFGLKTDYDAGWDGQYVALKSDIFTFNINPSLAYQANDKISLGAGINVQHIEATLSSNVSPLFGGASQTVTAGDTGWGYNLGAMFHLSPNTRIGAHYRSKIDYTLQGSVNFTGFLAAGNGSVVADLTVPASASLSVFSAVTPQWDLMADITWTQWSKLQAVSIVFTTGAPLGSSLLFNWDDTMRYSVGASYKPNQTWKFRVGVAYDETPTNNVDRTPRLPDEDRKWLALGVQYAMSKATKLDFGYAHEFIKDARVSNTNPVTAFGTPAGTLVGNYSNKVDILSVQLTHQF